MTRRFVNIGIDIKRWRRARHRAAPGEILIHRRLQPRVLLLGRLSCIQVSEQVAAEVDRKNNRVLDGRSKH